MSNFQAELKAFRDKAERRLAHVVQETVIGLGERLLDRSAIGQWDLWSNGWKAKKPMPPYEPGEFINSFKYSFGSVAYFGNGVEAPDPSGSMSLLEFQQVRSSPVSGIHFLFNASPLIKTQALENGWALDPTKAHMFDLAKIEFSSIVRESVAKAKVL